MIPIEITMLIVAGLMFIVAITSVVLLFIQADRTAKQLMAKSLQEYEAVQHPQKKEPSVYKDDETLYYENLMKQEKMQKELQGKIRALKQEEDAFKFTVNRSG